MYSESPTENARNSPRVNRQASPLYHTVGETKTQRRHAMFMSQRDFMVRKEQYKDLLREAERERLVSAVRGPSGTSTGLLHKVVEWFSAPRGDADPFPAPPTPSPAPRKQA
jgi:hypothetical protein